MTQADLLLQQPPMGPELFPDHIQAGAMELPLRYHLDPGSADDGVTAIVPLAALPALPAARFDWLVPGMLQEKIAALLKSLPKSLRTNFAPAAEFARACAEALTASDTPLVQAVGKHLEQITSVAVPQEAWNPGALPDHLRMSFRIVDDQGKTLATGRDLTELRRRFETAARQSFQKQNDSRYGREGIKAWDFGDMPPQIEFHRGGVTLRGYPALVDCGNSVALRLFEDAATASRVMRAGLGRLFALQVGDAWRSISRNLPGFDKLALQYATLGSAQELRDDLLNATVDRALVRDDGPDKVRTAMEFAWRLRSDWPLFEPAAERLLATTEKILAVYHAVQLRLAEKTAPAWAPAVADIGQQIALLLPKGFLTHTPAMWLEHLPRYLRAAEIRLGKLATGGGGLERDRKNMAELTPLWQRYLQRVSARGAANRSDPALEHYRWMIEEWRVSLFAQELGVSLPVSRQRLEKQWVAIQ